MFSLNKAAKDQHNQRLRHSHFGGDQQHHSGSSGLSEAYHSMQEENLDRIETVICDSEQLAMASRTGTKAKNFRGSEQGCPWPFRPDTWSDYSFHDSLA